MDKFGIVVFFAEAVINVHPIHYAKGGNAVLVALRMHLISTETTVSSKYIMFL